MFVPVPPSPTGRAVLTALLASLLRPASAGTARAAGISDYSILRDEETNTLFAVQTLAPGHTAAELRNTAGLQQWWAHMAPHMEANPDNSPVREPLPRFFHQD